ncbi:helix-turn-helix domain-containing protein [Pedobacter gandavensis]|uniref:Helix-turn-helix domain-containing protein n=1 Tax=Pedobacter gandavensis TaxID=2679963 RepID=A0ABR6F205_9SPHI|nr:helix-turn-helix transcriptional regulator [Pedobacter gandavensis]MBB2151568.1 helix-turn-helix domain-containing protein [Pedobacter gandavensis]
MKNKPHIGRNLSRIRLYYGMKQTTLAKALGISQQAVSKMEQQTILGDELLLRIGKILNVKHSLFKKLDPELGQQNITGGYDMEHNYDIENNSDMKLIIELMKRLIDSRKKNK